MIHCFAPSRTLESTECAYLITTFREVVYRIPPSAEIPVPLWHQFIYCQLLCHLALSLLLPPRDKGEICGGHHTGVCVWGVGGGGEVSVRGDMCLAYPHLILR